MSQKKLFMLLLGCRPKGRLTEQHDIFFGIGTNLRDLVDEIKQSWPEAKGNVHIDAWREVSMVNGCRNSIVEKTDDVAVPDSANQEDSLFFVNLGGYKEGEFDEFHYKILVVAKDLKMAQRAAMKSTFFKHYSIPKTGRHKKATAHIDDKYGIDVDEIYKVADILTPAQKAAYKIVISKGDAEQDNEMNLGYLKLTDLADNSRFHIL
jgi:hypothetical protein